MAFQLPPASAAPPMFGAQTQYQQQPQQMPQQNLLQSTQAVQPMMQPQQPVQTALPPTSAPAPNFRSYLGTQNTGGIRPGPQINGLSQRVGGIALQGANPQFRRYAGVN